MYRMYLVFIYLCLAAQFFVFSGADIKCHKDHKVAIRGEVPICLKCGHGTLMPENNHSNRDCYSCQQIPDNLEIDSYVASACNITGNKTAVDNDQHGRPLDIATFNCSHLPAVNKYCLGREIHSGDPNHAGNVTDRCTAQSARVVDDVFLIEVIFGICCFTVLLIASALLESVAWGKRFLRQLVNCLKDHLGVCLYMVLFVLVMFYLVKLFVGTETPELKTFILELSGFVVPLCVVALVAISYSYKLLLQDAYEKADPGSSCFLSAEPDATD